MALSPKQMEQRLQQPLGKIVPPAPIRKKNPLNTSEGLSSLGVSAGLEKDVARINALYEGEKPKGAFSGGFISDVIDGVNVLDYGVVGMLKGKSFSEGVKTRQSFSDQDALGSIGLSGVIVGIALDIAVDPLTYIAPWTLFKKIPSAIKVVQAIKKASIGKMVEKTIETGGKAKQVIQLEGGMKAGKYFADKFAYHFGVDPRWSEIHDKSVKNINVALQGLDVLVHGLTELSDGTAGKILTRDETGRIARVPLDELRGRLSPDDFTKVEGAWNKIDDLGKQAVDVGLLGKEKYEENLGQYIKNTYEEYELAKKEALFGSKKLKVEGIKSRVEGLTPEQMKELGQIENPAYLLFRTSAGLIRDIENATLFNKTAKLVGSEVAQEGFKQLPKTSRLITTAGKQAEILGNVKGINDKIKPLLIGLKATFKADKTTLADITRLENQFGELARKQGEELYKFFNEPTDITKTVETGRKLGIIPEKLQPIANSVKKFKTFEELQKTKEGIELEKFFINGDLERNGFKSMEQFFETVKNPYKAAETKDITKLAKGTPEFDAAVKARQAESDLVKDTGKAGDTPIIRDPNAPLKTRIMEGAMPKAITVTIKELTLLRQKIQNFNKGFKAGVAIAKKEIGNAQSDLITIIKNNFPTEEQGAFLTKVKNVTSPEKLTEAVDFLKTKFDDLLARQDELAASARIGKVVGLQREIEQILAKSKTLSEIDKRSINDSFRTLEKNINEARFAKEGLLQNLDDLRLAGLAGKYVPEPIYKLIEDIRSPNSFKFGSKLVGEFKVMKILFNPATHARNIVSNMILNWWKLGLGPWRVDKYIEAVKEIKNGGEYWKRAQAVGGGRGGMAAQELMNLLEDPALQGFGSKIGNAWGGLKKKLGDFYQGEESVAKLTAFIDQTKKGLSDEDAWKVAESATFNYAQVTPFVRRLRTEIWGYPFITFPLKATPIAIETALKNPQRISVFGKIKNSLENMSDIKETERERASEPQWVRDGFYIKLPIKDSQGRSAYFDLTYILPFGDLASGKIFQKQLSRETGLPEEKAVTLASVNPVFNLMKELNRNQDFFGNKIWKESDRMEKRLGDIMRHLTKTYMPPPVANEIPGGYRDSGERDQRGFQGAAKPKEKENQQRTVMQEMFANVGMKVQPVIADIQETQKEWNKSKAMNTLLREKGVIKELNIPYVPKK